MSTIHNENRGPELLAVSWTFTSIAVVFVALKIFTRARIMKDLGWDDFFIFLSLLLILICTSIFTYDVHIGMGRHAQTLEPSQLSRAVKINFIANPFGIMAYSFPNISVSILVNRILPKNHVRAFALYALAISQCLIAAISSVLLFVQCLPSKHLWDPTVPATCLSPSVITGYSYFVGSYSAFTDIVLAVVPIAAFWNLHMKLKTKIGLCILMGLTLVAAICAIVKTTKLNELGNLEDFTYGTVDLVIWVIVEASVIIMAACVPTLRPFVNSLSGGKKTSEGGSWFRSRGYFSFDGRKPIFRSKQSSRGSGLGSTTMELPSRSDRGEASQDSMAAIEKTTEIRAEWEAV